MYKKCLEKAIEWRNAFCLGGETSGLHGTYFFVRLKPCKWVVSPKLPTVLRHSQTSLTTTTGDHAQEWFKFYSPVAIFQIENSFWCTITELQVRTIYPAPAVSPRTIFASEAFWYTQWWLSTKPNLPIKQFVCYLSTLTTCNCSICLHHYQKNMVPMFLTSEDGILCFFFFLQTEKKRCKLKNVRLSIQILKLHLYLFINKECGSKYYSSIRFSFRTKPYNTIRFQIFQ